MPADDKVDALLDRWYESQSAGQALTPAELCRDTPDLLPEFQRCLTLLHRFEALRSDPIGETLDRPPAATTTLPERPVTYGTPTTPSSALPRVGEDFDGYRIVAELGRGGMGCVFRARNPVLNRDEALKVMLPEVAARPQARERFLREARAMAAVRHDHIVEVYHVREIGGVPYLAMPLLAGETLAERLKREKTLSPAEVIRLGLQMADGLGAAHAQGLIHRDIKPGNVWLEAGTNRVKLLDFGLVRAEGMASDLTGEGALLGTPAYMSPEQVDGKALDGRSDLFSVGSVLYECATGRRAFSGTSLTAILSAVAQVDPPAARAVDGRVPAGLSDLLGALLHKNPERRPATALELARRLRVRERGGPTAEEMASTVDYKPAVLRWRQWPWLAARGCILGLGAFSAIAISKGWFADRPLDNIMDTTESKPNMAPVTPPPKVEPLRVVKIDVHHTEKIDKDKPKDRGLIGEQSFAAMLGDQVTIEATLSRPAYAYLIAFNPDGTFVPCFPDPLFPDERPPLTDHLQYPPPVRLISALASRMVTA